MLCKCIDFGQARRASDRKIIWCEPGQIHDIEVKNGKIPAHFTAVEEAKKPAVKGKTITKKEEDEL